jgi:hypothetical protein
VIFFGLAAQTLSNKVAVTLMLHYWSFCPPLNFTFTQSCKYFLKICCLFPFLAKLFPV